ncbi:MAG: hypothetical protein WCI17_03130 [bacterium]
MKASTDRKRVSNRTLLYFPIVHSQSEMGKLGKTIRKVTQQKLGRRVWQRKVDLVDRFWEHLAEIVFQDLAIPYARTRVYQDGLPVCDKEIEIVTEIAKLGSPNHRLLLQLREKGATIMGTESAELLIREYRLAKEILNAGDAREALELEAQQKAAGEQLLEKRDAFIAARIDQTLLAGETGLLFLGMLHSPVARLPPDIRVLYPLEGLLEKGGPLDSEVRKR